MKDILWRQFFPWYCRQSNFRDRVWHTGLKMRLVERKLLKSSPQRLSDLLLLWQLIDKGLTVEALDAPVGVLLLRKDVQNPKTVSDAIAGGLEIREFHLGSGPTDRDLSPED